MANAAVLACTESGQQPSAICTKLGIPTSFRWSRLPYVPFPFRVERIVKISQMREAERLQTKGKKINMEFKRNNQLYKNIYNPTYKRFITASQILIDFLKYPFGDYFCYLF